MERHAFCPACQKDFVFISTGAADFDLPCGHCGHLFSHMREGAIELHAGDDGYELSCPSCGSQLSLDQGDIAGEAELDCPTCAERMTVRPAGLSVVPAVLDLPRSAGKVMGPIVLGIAAVVLIIGVTLLVLMVMFIGAVISNLEWGSSNQNSSGPDFEPDNTIEIQSLENNSSSSGEVVLTWNASDDYGESIPVEIWIEHNGSRRHVVDTEANSTVLIFGHFNCTNGLHNISVEDEGFAGAEDQISINTEFEEDPDCVPIRVRTLGDDINDLSEIPAPAAGLILIAAAVVVIFRKAKMHRNSLS